MDADSAGSPGGPASGRGGSPLKSESWLERRRRLGRDMTLALVGFPNSGKTSYLYALKSIPRPGRPSRWRVGGGSAEFASLTGVAGQPQRATGAGHLDFARLCRVVRPVLNIAFLGWALGRARWLTTAEVSGETLQRISEGSTDLEGSAAEFLEFLGHSTVILGFASLDGLRASRGVGAASDADEALLGSLKAIERIIESAAQRRSGIAHPLVMSLLITKADMLAESPELDQIDLPSDRSTVGSIAADRGGPIGQWLEASGSGGGRVRYRVSHLICHELARGDLDVNEALAADFLKCHAPKSARQVAAMQSDRVLGASIRVFMCSPYGTAFSDERGGDTFPRADQMRPVMVHEPLESALERAWAHRDGDRRRRHSVIAAAAALALVVVLPATRWFLGARADSALERARDTGAFNSWVDARDSVRAIELSPEVAMHQAVPLMRWLSPRVMDQHAWRLRQCAELAQDHGLDEASLLADRALALTPDDPDATKLVMDLRVQRVAAYLDGRADSLPRRGMDLDSGGVAVMIVELDRLSTSWRDRAASDREALDTRLRDLQGALESGSAESAQLRVGGEGDRDLLRAAIARSIAAVSGSRPGTAGAAAADPAAVDTSLRSGDLSAARKGCDDIVSSHVARWSEVSRGGDPWPAGPAWLEDARIRRESEAVRRMALDRRRRLDATAGRIGAATGDARERRVAECMELVQDLLWARTHPAGSASDAFDEAGWAATEVVAARDRVLTGLGSAQPWPRAALAQVAAAFGGDDAGPLQGLLAGQRMMLADRLRHLAGVAERESGESQWQEVLAAMRDARVATEDAIKASDERFLALRAARASPIDVTSLERHLRGYATHEPDPEARLSVARAVMGAVGSACCTISAADLGRSIEAVVPLGIQRSAAASELLAATQMCFLSQGGIDGNAIAAQAGRLDLLAPMSAVPWREGLRPSIEGVRRWFDSARGGDDLGPDAPSAASLRAMRGMRSLAGDQQFQSLMNACMQHAELVRKWQLLKVPAGRGRGAEGGCWLSRLEWSRSKQVAATLRACERGALEQAMRGPLKGLVVSTPGGFAWAPLRDRERLELLDANLGISDARSADALVRLAGLRLPTVAELDMAVQRPGALSESGRKQLAPMRDRYLTPESLAEVDRTQDGIVGLNSGVCEWTAEGLWGKTHMTSTSDDNIKPYVQGVRPALDVIPSELRQALAP